MRLRIPARTTRAIAIALLATLLVGLLPGCANEPAEEPVAGEPVAPAPVRIGVLPTEDSLPLWVAAEEGLFEEAGLDVEFVNFQAAQERDAAFAAGEIDAFMGDIIASALLEQGGSGVTIATVMLGMTPAQGRFGIVAAPDSGFQDITALAGVPVGTSSGTIQEYVLDGLMRQAGVPEEQVIKEEVKKVPVRFDLLMNGQLKAAALPEPFLTLAETQGALLLADDTAGENLSQTVLGFSDEYLVSEGGIEAMTALLEVWDEAVALVNADPDAYRGTLVEQAKLPEPIKDSYTINTYPEHSAATKDQVAPVLQWMSDEGLLEGDLLYEDLVIVTP